MNTDSEGNEKEPGASGGTPMKVRLDYVVAGLIALLVIGYIGREWIGRPAASPAAQAAPTESADATAKFQEYTKTGLHYYYDTREFDKAEAEFRKSIDAAPTRALGYSNLGSSLNEQKKWDEAIIVLEKAVALDPNLVIAKNNLAWARVEKSKLSK
jgi:tetratricopeptide (TPR) repeat protein